MKSLAIIIIHWNAPDRLNELLTALNLTSDNELDFEVIVVDNNSTDSIEKIKRKFPNVVWLENKINYGYAFACNQATLKAQAPWLLFLNPDVELTPIELTRMLELAQANKLDATSPHSTTSGYQKSLPSLLSLVSEFTPLKLPSFSRKKTLTGGLLLIKKQVLEKIGGWDERFFLWFEDSDLTKRLYDHQFSVGFIDIAVKHEGGYTLKKLPDQTQMDIFFHSLNVYAAKHFNWWQRFITSKISSRYTSRKTLPVLNHDCSITIPNMRLELLDNFLQTNSKYFSPTNQIIVVSSAIRAKDFWTWKDNYPTIRFILPAKNFGFAQTVNIGLKVSTSKWAATVNDDVVLAKNWLEELISNHNPNTIGSINPVVLTPEGQIESAGIRLQLKGKADPITQIFTENISPVDATNAACVVYSQAALNQVGLFDEKFGSYLEDIDLSLRMTKAGYKNILNPTVKITHLKHQTAKFIGRKKQWLDLKNWWLVIIKNWSLKSLLLNAPNILLERLRNISGVIK